MVQASARRSAPPRVAVVTGANRGLGREVCAQLAAQGWRVWLTARDPAQAQAAAAALGAGPDAVRSHGLDVTAPSSVAGLAATLRERGEPIAALVNNAGVSLRGFNAEVVRGTLAVNYHGAERVTDALLPLLAPGACIVMVSSGMGELSGFGPALRKRFLQPGLTREALQGLLAEFLAAVERKELERLGWPRSAYSVSKAALNALTRILARELGAAGPRVNAVCPGWVRTDMGGRSASRSVQIGARGIVWAATLPAGGPSGGFFRDGKAIDW
jgi:NAD(P)-dependent dehydrogenase (short-subunit alcohol dehydrogenase family)